MPTLTILKQCTKEMCQLAFARISNSSHFKPLSHTAQPDYIPPEADALAFPHVGSAATSSWLGFGSLSSTCELRNHFRSDPVQVQSTMLQCIISGYLPGSACVAIVDCACNSQSAMGCALVRARAHACVCVCVCECVRVCVRVRVRVW